MVTLETAKRRGSMKLRTSGCSVFGGGRSTLLRQRGGPASVNTRALVTYDIPVYLVNCLGVLKLIGPGCIVFCAQFQHAPPSTSQPSKLPFLSGRITIHTLVLALKRVTLLFIRTYTTRSTRDLIITIITRSFQR